MKILIFLLIAILTSMYIFNESANHCYKNWWKLYKNYYRETICIFDK